MADQTIVLCFKAVQVTPKGHAAVELMNALNEWRDTGGHALEVVGAIDNYIAAKLAEGKGESRG